jgi:DNA-binding NtrC family response regulator
VKEKLEALVLQMIDQDIGFEDACVEFERRFIRKVLEKVDGNKSKAAVTLGIHRNTLARKIGELGLNHQPSPRRRRTRR